MNMTKVYEYVGAAYAARISEGAYDHADKLWPKLSNEEVVASNRLISEINKSFGLLFEVEPSPPKGART